MWLWCARRILVSHRYDKLVLHDHNQCSVDSGTLLEILIQSNSNLLQPILTYSSLLYTNTAYLYSTLIHYELPQRVFKPASCSTPRNWPNISAVNSTLQFLLKCRINITGLRIHVYMYDTLCNTNEGSMKNENYFRMWSLCQLTLIHIHRRSPPKPPSGVATLVANVFCHPASSSVGHAQLGRS